MSELKIVPTATGMVNIRAGHLTAEITWPDAVRIGRTMQAMAAVAANHIDVEEETFRAVFDDAADTSEAMALHAAEELT